MFPHSILYLKKKEPIILYSNGTEITWSTSNISSKDFKNNTIIFDNLTQPPSAGLEVITKHVMKKSMN